MATDALITVERRRSQLEENVAKLAQALRHWRTWDAEYEGLREELSGLPDDFDEKTIRQLAAGYGGELVNEREILEITGAQSGSLRSTDKVIDLVRKRQDYVSQNITTLDKQYEAASITLGDLEGPVAVDAVAENGRLPISEIIEELDENDHVLSSRIAKPADAAANILDTLRKAGIEDGPGSGTKTTDKRTKSEADVNLVTEQGTVRDLKGRLESKAKTSTASNGKSTSAQLTSRVTNTNASVASPANPQSKPVSASLLRGSFVDGEKVIELDEDDTFLASTAVIPQDESPEDAAARREMLNYHLNEVKNVVAEIDLLDDDQSDDDEEDDLDDLEGMSDLSDVSGEEDQYGRSLSPQVTRKYQKQMLELQERLEGVSIQNLGPKPEGLEALPPAKPSLTAGENLPQVTQAGRDENKTRTTGDQAKSVRFADSLDISQDKPAKGSPISQSSRPVSNPLASTVTERFTTEPRESDTTPKAKPAKVSRFKQARSTDAPNPESQSATPRAERARTLNEVVAERAPASGATAPAEEDEFDPEIQRRQLASEYYRLRNAMIQEQGGFKLTEEDREDPLLEQQEDGKVKKVSRFKAARLRAEQ